MTKNLVAKLKTSLATRTTAALFVGGAAALTFVEVVENALQKEATPFDRKVSLWLHQLDSPAMDLAMRALTFLGSGPVVIATVVVIVAWAIRRHAYSSAVVLAAVGLVAEGLNILLKWVFQRERPDLFFKITAPESYSFPSGHAMAATAVYGMCAVVVAQLRADLRKPLAMLMPVLILMIGVSRVYLGVHWPTDILAGFAAGLLLLLAGLFALARFSRPRTSGPT